MAVTPQHRVLRSERVALMQPCTYELTEAHDSETILLHQGEALSVNVSSGGMLILMPHTFRQHQMFEVHVPTHSPGEKRLALVEVRWSKQVPLENGDCMSFVGVKFLMTPTLPQPACE